MSVTQRRGMKMGYRGFNQEQEEDEEKEEKPTYNDITNGE